MASVEESWLKSLAEPGERIGRGETVSPQLVHDATRTLFEAVLNEIAPHIWDDLRTPEMKALCHRHGTAKWARIDMIDVARVGSSLCDDSTLPDDIRGPCTAFSEVIDQCEAELHCRIDRWQAAHGLNAEWLHWKAWNAIVAYAGPAPRLPRSDGESQLSATIESAFSAQSKRFLIYMGRTPIPEPSPEDGPLTLRALPELPAGPEPVFLDDLYGPAGVCSGTGANGSVWEDWYDERNDAIPIGEFDTRTETIDAAMARIVPVIRARLRRALQRRVDADIADAAGLRARRLPHRDHVIWFVRYQVCGVSASEIAQGRNTAHVRRTLRPIAKALGITLREPGPPGRRPRIVTKTEHT